MNANQRQYEAENDFRRAVNTKLRDPLECINQYQIRKCIEDLHFIIAELEIKYNYIPERASMLFDRYNSIYDKMVYEKFIREYSF